MGRRVLVVNPGSRTTKVALFEDGREALSREAACDPGELAAAKTSFEQAGFRLRTVEECLAAAGVEVKSLGAVAARGGPLRPVPGGVYRVNEAMLADARSDEFTDHVSRLGCVLADRLARPAGVPAYVVDPVSVDEYDEVSRFSGLPELPRRSLTHALNMKAVARRCAAEAGRPYAELNLIVAHLGGGISIAVHAKGKMVDSVDANGEGPMSPERSGGLRVDDLVDLCFSGKFTREELKRRITREAGLFAHLGTADAVEVEKRIADGDERARAAYEALAYGVSKHVAGLSAAVEGRVDAVILTGGLARSACLVDHVTRRIKFLGKVVVYPGEGEMRALYEGAERVLAGREKARLYPSGEEEG